MKAIIFFLFLIAGCGCTSKDGYAYTSDIFTTTQGFYVDPGGFETSPKQVEFVIDLIPSLLVARLPHRYEQRHVDYTYTSYSFSVKVVQEEFDCGDVTCVGLWDGTSEITYKYEECLGKTSLAHELIHLMGAYVDNNGLEDDHMDPALFADAEGPDDESIEMIAEEILCNAFCDC